MELINRRPVLHLFIVVRSSSSISSFSRSVGGQRAWEVDPEAQPRASQLVSKLNSVCCAIEYVIYNEHKMHKQLTR